MLTDVHRKANIKISSKELKKQINFQEQEYFIPNSKFKEGKRNAVICVVSTQKFIG